MKALVTGATGFSGAALVKKLLEYGHEVKVIVRDQSKLVNNNPRLNIVEGNIINLKDVERSIDGVDTVFHIAAVYRTAGISEDIYWATHVKGTENLLKAALKGNVNKFVHCSTVGVHGHIEQPPATENYRFKPGDIYQLTKLEGEKKALEFYRSEGLPVTVIRPTAIYGPGDTRLLKLFKLASKPINIVLGSGEEVLTLNALLSTISELMNVSNKKIHLPAWPFQMAGTICERICIPLNIDPPIYRRRVDFFTKSRAFSIEKAQNILGYEPKTSIHEGLFKTLQWYEQKDLI